MKSLHTIALISTAAFSLAVVGCSSSETIEGEDVVAAPVFDDGQGQEAVPEAADTPAYPGPYSNNVGGTVRNYGFRGYANYIADPTISDVQLSHFYNPDWASKYGPGSIHGEGTAKPKAVVLMMSSVWCGPCKYEAEVVLPVEIPQYPEAQFVGSLIDGPQPGTPCSYLHLTNWVDDYQQDVQYPMVIDPTEQITPIMEPAYPSNMIIDTRTMQIMFMEAGAIGREFPSGVSFWAALEAILADNYEPGQSDGQF
jgi:hypothetical protein